jgi:hypothetical protein
MPICLSHHRAVARLAVGLRLVDRGLQRIDEAQRAEREAWQQAAAGANAELRRGDAPAVLAARLADAERQLAELRHGGAGR